MYSNSINSYLNLTRTASYGFIAAIPLFIIYEIFILFINLESNVSIRVGADIWLKQILSTIGVRGHHTVGLIAAIFGLIIFFIERRKKDVRVKFFYFPWMIVESLFYSIFFAIIISKTVTFVFSSAYWYKPLALEAINGAPPSDFWLQITLSIGAGLYEELVFRVLLISCLYFFISYFVLSKGTASYVASALIAALLFSAVHYIGSYGDVFTIPSFTFRLLFGLAFNILYVVRGFGVTAWSHSLYDVLLTVFMQSD